MKRIAFYLATVLLATVFYHGTLQAQNPTSTVDILNERGSKFSQNGVNLVREDLKIIANTHPDSREIFDQAIINHVWASILGGVGGFAVGYSMGRWLFAANGELNLPLLMSGVAVMSFTIPLWTGYARHARKAMKVHNAHILENAETRAVPSRLELGWTSQGLGFQFRF